MKRSRAYEDLVELETKAQDVYMMEKPIAYEQKIDFTTLRDCKRTKRSFDNLLQHSDVPEVQKWKITMHDSNPNDNTNTTWSWCTPEEFDPFSSSVTITCLQDIFSIAANGSPTQSPFNSTNTSAPSYQSVNTSSLNSPHRSSHGKNLPKNGEINQYKPKVSAVNRTKRRDTGNLDMISLFNLSLDTRLDCA